MSEPFSLEHFEEWASGMVLDDGEHWRLEEFQRDFVDDFFGLQAGSEAWLIVPEGNGKTTLIAGLALYGLRFSEDASIPVAASTRDQARIMYRQAKGFLRRSRLDGDGVTFEAFDGYRRIDLRGLGKTRRGEVLGSIEIHAAEAGAGDGIIPFPFALTDELHRHKSLDLYQTWRGKLGKRGARLVAISTGGEEGSEFEETRERIRQDTPALVRVPGFTKCVGPRVLLHDWALEEGGDPDDMVAVKRCNPLPSVTVESLAAKRGSPTMTPQHWGRFVCNLPMRSSSAAIQEQEWYDATADGGIPHGAEVWVGLDVAWRWDTTALVPLWWSDDVRLLGEAAILEPPGDGSSLHPDRVRLAFQDLCARYEVSTVVMDMNRAEDIAAWLSDELGLVVIDRAQTNKPQAEDFERFMEGLRSGVLKHSGDSGLRRHALNAVSRVLPSGGAKFDRPVASRTGNQSTRVIDALVAAAMVYSFAVEKHLEPESTPLVAWA